MGNKAAGMVKELLKIETCGAHVGILGLRLKRWPTRQGRKISHFPGNSIAKVLDSEIWRREKVRYMR